MRTCAKIGGSVVFAATVALLGSQTAQADDANLLRSARDLGFLVSDYNLLAMGHSACYFLSLNRDPGQVTDRIRRYGNVEPDAAGRFLSLAVQEYCPQYGNRVGL